MFITVFPVCCQANAVHPHYLRLFVASSSHQCLGLNTAVFLQDLTIKTPYFSSPHTSHVTQLTILDLINLIFGADYTKSSLCSHPPPPHTQFQVNHLSRAQTSFWASHFRTSLADVLHLMCDVRFHIHRTEQEKSQALRISILSLSVDP